MQTCSISELAQSVLETAVQSQREVWVTQQPGAVDWLLVWVVQELVEVNSYWQEKEKKMEGFCEVRVLVAVLLKEEEAALLLLLVVHQEVSGDHTGAKKK